MRTSKDDKRKTRKNRDSVRFEFDAERMEENSLRYFRMRNITTTAKNQHRLERGHGKCMYIRA